MCTLTSKKNFRSKVHRRKERRYISSFSDSMGLIGSLYLCIFGAFLASSKSTFFFLFCIPLVIIHIGPCSPNQGCITTLRSDVQELITQCWIYSGWATKRQSRDCLFHLRTDQQRICCWLYNVGATVNNRHCEAEEKCLWWKQSKIPKFRAAYSKLTLVIFWSSEWVIKSLV